MNFPIFDNSLPFLNQFILKLVEEYETGTLDSWEKLEDQCRQFYTSEIMDAIEAKTAGWKKMASYSGGITVVHVTCVFLGMFMLPEFQALSAEQKQIAKWIILFHDIDKIHLQGKRDLMHPFNSAVVAANTLPRLGFPVEEIYRTLIDPWSKFTRQSFVKSLIKKSSKPDNRKLPHILSDIDLMFGRNTPACLITKTVLLHISLAVDKNYPTPSPLTKKETKEFISPILLPLLKVMMLSDNEGWSLFDPDVRAQQRRDTLFAFEGFQELIGTAS